MNFRLATWNVNMALARKRDALNRLRADVAVLQEIANVDLPSERSVWVGHLPRKGLGVEVAHGFSITIDPAWDERIEFVVPCRVTGPVEFGLLAVWAMHERAVARYPEVPDRRQVLQALDVYEPLIESGPWIVAGDFNNAVRWDRPGKAWNHSALVERMSELGLVSAYHAVRGQSQGHEDEPTIYWTWNARRPYHIDYVFVPDSWVAAVKSVEIGSFDDWVASRLSDHVPVVLELEADVLAHANA